jgi:serine protease AprX
VIAHLDGTFTPSPGRRIFCSIFFVPVAIAVLGAIGSSRATGQGGPGATANKIEPWVIEHTANGQPAELMVVLVDQADVRPAAALATKNEKSRYVHDALWSKSQATQAPILQWLRERGVEHLSFYIINAILVKGSRDVAETLAARPDVARVEGNPQIQNVLPQPIPAVEAPSQPETPNAIGPNINYTHAPQVWALGFTGQGLVIGSADTGVRWTHNALKRHYRGWNGTMVNHDYNWHDSVHNSASSACGNNAHTPCDDNGHGTHTIGTAIGDDGMGNQIGMAPGAKWIGCRNMDQGNGTPARYIECMEFFLAPYPVGGTPAQGDPTLAPDITTNSWTCPTSEGCSVNTLQAAVEAQQAAGIMMVVAAGNQGPGCSTLLNPPSFYQASYTVGALTTGTDNIAPFSNRGPVSIDGSHRLKPDITAPGTDIRSSLNTSDNAYGTMTGTSMATPHIAGAVALLWSARPEWRHDIDSSRTAIDDAAVHILNGVCDSGQSVTPNNTYGHGRVNILAAMTETSLGNISTRSFVQTGEHVMIGGFIVQGTRPKRVIIRAIGPELTQYGIANALANPRLELHNGTGALIATNDDWQTTILGGIITSNQVSDIQNSAHAPTAASESAIIANLQPGNYTAIVRGVNNTTGVALVEVYDLSPGTTSILGNISTRSFVQTGEHVMIGGFIVQGTGPTRVIIRAIGPELTQYGITNALANPKLELHNGTGALIATNDDWQTTVPGGIITSNQVSEIQNSGHTPTAVSESAIIANLQPGNYTAIVRGVNNTTGVALVEVYGLN